MFNFKVKFRGKKTKARVGTVRTSHGDFETPAFIPVATQASIKSLTPEEVKDCGSQVVLCNTYHLYLSPKAEVVQKMGGLHNFMRWNGPIVTDSGGFQVFSLGMKLKAKNSHGRSLVKITDDGVMFQSHIDGSSHYITPEKSIEIQQKLGSDITIAFDHCPPHPATHQYVKMAVERTNHWAKRCLAVKKRDNQALYGVIQGGIYEDLRIKSAQDIAKLPFDGLAIGGIAVGEGKNEMYDAISWVTPFLPEEKPRHLLGVGDIDDIFMCVEKGIDSFDCVTTTRLGRMGHVFTKDKKNMGNKKWLMDVTKAKFKDDSLPIEKDCTCFTCQNFMRSYVNHLFRSEELLASRLATIHNIFFLTQLLKEIRRSIAEGQLAKLSQKWLE